MTFNSSFSQKTLNILKASLPFIPPGMQRMVSNFVKIEEFNIMVKNLNDSLDSTISACEYNSTGNNNPFNSGDLISAIKPYLNDNEKELIDMLFNMMNALKIYNMFKSFPSVNAPASQNNENPDFEIHNFDNQDNQQPDYDNHSQNNDISNDNVSGPDYQNYDNSGYFEADINESNETADNENSSISSQNNFNIEALKNLLSPSQKAMFETYSALLNNNSSNTIN